MKAATSTTDTSSAPRAPKSEVSIIADVRTNAGRENTSVKIEVRAPAALKTAAMAKAKRENTDISKVVVRHLEDYVAGPLLGGRPDPSARRSRGLQGAELRRNQAEILNHLRDLRSLFSIPESPLAQPAIQKFLERTEQLSRASFNLLRRHVP